tara:strand:- start:9785 stop:10675 length:891 start_codon:yes stop_codon:yes gene_type:complete
MEIRKSERRKAKMKLALQGSSGSGKTYSSLLIAKGLAGNDFTKVAVIDTENGSADLYAHLGDYNVISLQPPYSPERYIEAINLCENAGIEVVIIDSISHCWDYLLDVHSNMVGNSFTNWGKITPRQNAFVNKILQSDTHIIATMRVKQDYVLNQKNGKTIPEKVGLKAVQRNDVDYEFTIVFDIDIAHNAKASKDRTGLFIDKPEFVINTATGKKLLAWCNEGSKDEIDCIKADIENCTSLDELRAVYLEHPEIQSKIKNLVLQKKEQIEKINSQIIPTSKIVESKNINNNENSIS